MLKSRTQAQENKKHCKGLFSNPYITQKKESLKGFKMTYTIKKEDLKEEIEKLNRQLAAGHIYAYSYARENESFFFTVIIND